MIDVQNTTIEELEAAILEKTKQTEEVLANANLEQANLYGRMAKHAFEMIRAGIYVEMPITKFMGFASLVRFLLDLFDGIDEATVYKIGKANGYSKSLMYQTLRRKTKDNVQPGELYIVDGIVQIHRE